MIPSAPDNRAVSPGVLTNRQREVYEEIERYTDFAQEPPSVAFIARRLGMHWTTVQEHLEALHRKHWIPSARPFLHRR